MRRNPATAIFPLLLLLLSAFHVGCGSALTSSTSARSGPVPEGGFALQERVRVGSKARSVFAEGVKALEDGDTRAASRLFESLVAEPEAPVSAHINLAIARRAENDFEGARSTLESALEKHPKHPVTRNELGITLRRLGEFALAREQYEAALATHPEFHFARKNLAILCDLYLSDLSCALDHYRAFAAANPGDETTRIWIADLESRNGKARE